MPSQDALNSADEVLKDMAEVTGRDYGPGRDEIARVFDDDLWNGNWDSSTDFKPELHLADLRFIQEDEYDQHMDEDEDKPEDEIMYSAGHYVFYA